MRAQPANSRRVVRLRTTLAPTLTSATLTRQARPAAASRNMDSGNPYARTGVLSSRTPCRGR